MIQLFQAMFISLATTLPGRVLSALGIGILSYAAITTAMTALVAATVQQWALIPTNIYQLVSLAGFTDAVGILTAALTTKASIAALPRLGKLS